MIVASICFKYFILSWYFYALFNVENDQIVFQDRLFDSNDFFPTLKIDLWISLAKKYFYLKSFFQTIFTKEGGCSCK